ncbi:hypothetical protein COB18_03225 [Candidatus Kaiserbacteria bacterium]|nr:MAG: hypothetical protein COB18_03225 [Candidatus Kaiserbacteria bacterium]
MTEENNTETEVDTAELQVYELGYHILPTVVIDDLEGEVAKLRSAVEARGGSFISEATPEMMNLAYPIFVNNGGKKTRYETAYFGWMKFEMNQSQAIDLRDADLSANAQVLRHILVTTTREETRAQMQTAQNNVLREIHTNATLEKKQEAEEGGEISEKEIEKSIEEIVEEKKPEAETKTTE